ncbi:MAG: methylated-DNA--[protein]-cysteine S-methyltransferase [Acidobacteriia bacterium]|nr:methylated-DNA--[protein]-cysteine S-methyltransferase [Terriglobia bacterium]
MLIEHTSDKAAPGLWMGFGGACGAVRDLGHNLPLAPEGTPFQLKVWRQLCDIKYGQTISYGELARRIGNPKASRAVGLANGSNPISIVIPCHRVIGSNGKLTGYGGGLPIKEKLLALERRQLRLL